MSTHVYVTIELSTKGGDRYRIRKAGKADARQQEIYTRLGIDWENLPSQREKIAG